MSYTIITPVLLFYKVQTTYLGQDEKKPPSMKRHFKQTTNIHFKWHLNIEYVKIITCIGLCRLKFVEK